MCIYIYICIMHKVSTFFMPGVSVVERIHSGRGPSACLLASLVLGSPVVPFDRSRFPINTGQA